MTVDFASSLLILRKCNERSKGSKTRGPVERATALHPPVAQSVCLVSQTLDGPSTVIRLSDDFFERSERAKMAIDVKKEQAITLSDVPNHIPKRRGKKVHYSTVYRWVTKGSRGRILESVLVGGVRFTTIEAIERFLNSESCRSVSSDGSVMAAVDAALDASGL